jgi:hypothetical protein
MRKALLATFLLVPAAAVPCLLPEIRSSKPEAPIDLEARIVGDPSAPFAVHARASSRTQHEVELELVLPEGITHLAGERRAHGRQCDLRVDLHAPDDARRGILVRATIREGDAKLVKVVPLVLHDRPAASKGTPRKNAQGEAILEFGP